MDGQDIFDCLVTGNKYHIWAATYNIGASNRHHFEGAIPILIECVKGEIEDDNLPPPFEINPFHMMSAPPSSLETAAWKAIGRIGSRRGRAANVLNEIIWGPDGLTNFVIEETRYENGTSPFHVFIDAIDAMGSCGNEETISHLVDTIEQYKENPYIRTAAIQAIGGILGENITKEINKKVGISALAKIFSEYRHDTLDKDKAYSPGGSPGYLDAGFALGCSKSEEAFNILFSVIESGVNFPFVDIVFDKYLAKVSSAENIITLSQFINFDKFTVNTIPPRWQASEKLFEIWIDNADSIVFYIINRVFPRVFAETPIAFLKTLDTDNQERFLFILEKYLQLKQPSFS